MTVLKRMLALLLALMLCMMPLVQVYAEDVPDPTDPTDPTPTDPIDPTEPTDPTDPTEPTEPEIPLEVSLELLAVNGGNTEPLPTEWVNDSNFGLRVVVFVNREDAFEKDLVGKPVLHVNGAVVELNEVGESTTSKQYEAPIGWVEGENTVEASTNYVNGEETLTASASCVVKVDTVQPKFTNVQFNDIFYDKENKCLYVKDSIKVSLEFDDTPGSGIAKISKLVDNVVQTEYSETTFNDEVPDGELFTTNYRVEDNAGNLLLIDLVDLLDAYLSIQPGLHSDEVSVEFDTEAPEIEYTLTPDAVYSNSDTDYYAGAVTLDVSAADHNISKLDVSVNGTEYSSTTTDSVGAKINLKDIVISDISEAVIVITAYDIVGHETSKTVTFMIDTEPPVKNTLSVEGEGVEFDNKYYTRGLSITGRPADTVSGLKNVEIYKDGTVVGDSLPYAITENGDYSVKAYDNVGNFAVWTLAELAGIETSTVVVDEFNPTVTVALKEDAVYTSDATKYYNGDTTIHVTASDYSLRSVAVKVNGKICKSIETSGYNVEPVEFDVPVSLSGEIHVVVTAKDVLGATTVKELHYVNDTTRPERGDLKVTGTFVEKVGKLFVDGQLVIEGQPSDSESGVASIVIYKNDTIIEGAVLPYDVKESGVYLIKVTDNVGNSVTWKLSELLEGAVSNDVVIDNDLPDVTAEIVESPVYEASGVKYYNGDTTLKVVINETNIEEIVVTINGEPYRESELEFEQVLKDTGHVDITVSATDYYGHEGKASISYVNDVTSPEVGSMKVTGNFKQVDADKALYVADKLVIDGTPTDPESGIASVEVYNGETLVSEKLPFDIVDSGTYKVKVTDNVGNSDTWELSKLLEGAEYSKVVIDTEDPRIEKFVDPSDKVNYKDSDGVDWFIKSPLFTFNVTDVNIEEVSIKIGDQQVFAGVNEDGVYTVDLTKYTSDALQFTITAKDKAGNISDYNYSFRVDTVPVDLSELLLSVNGTKYESGGIVYTNGSFVFSGSISDTLSGLKEFVIMKNGEVVYTNSNGTISYEISNEAQSGTYTVKATDNVGNVSEMSAADLLKTLSSYLLVDHTNPVITRVDTNKETVTGWYNYAPVLKYSVSESNLSAFVITINGDEVLRTSGAGTYEINTSKYNNRAVSVVVRAVDKAGNAAEVTYSYTHDDTPPSNLSATAAAPSNNVYGNAYYLNNVSVSYAAQDSGYGSIKYHVIDSNGKEHGIDEELGSGEYYVCVEDGLGNASSRVTLGSLLGWEGNNLIVDLDVPVITGVPQAGVWRNSHATYSLSSSDTNGIARYAVFVNGKSLNIVNSSSIVSPVAISFDTTKSEMNNDGSYNIEVRAWDNAGREASWKDIYYLDTDAPEVVEFVLNNTVNSIGNSINGEDKFGFFFNGNGSVTVKATDAAPSAGISSIFVKLDGADWESHNVDANGTVTVNIPVDYKGGLQAYAVDKVNNKGSEKKPDLLVSESATTHANNTSIGFVLPDTPYKDAAGLPLYNKDVVVTANLKSTWAGIKSINYSVSGVESAGNVSGTQEKNIVVAVTQNIAVTGNTNGIPIELTVGDWAGYTSKASTELSIDKDAPVISVSYNNTTNSGFYNSDRVATIVVNEVNFDPAGFRVDGAAGVLGTWNSNGNVWTNTMTFASDGDYGFSLDCTDRAGNNAIRYTSEQFTIDKTAPVMTVTWSNNTANNVNHFDNDRIATVTVVEHNFDPSLVVLTGSGQLGGWTNNGDTHTATISFTDDGEYSFTLACTDKAGNSVVEPYSSGIFIIDKTAPEITIKGVTDGVSYKSSVGFIVEIADNYLDSDEISVVLVGRNHEEVKISGEYNEKLSTYEFTEFPVEVSTDDVYTLKVSVKDKAGNETTKELSFSVNRFGSKYGFYDEAYLDSYLNEPKDIEISELNVDRLEKDSVKVSITLDGKPIEVKDEWVEIIEEEVNGKYLYTYKISKSAFASDGKYSVSVASKSFDGTDYTSETESYNFVVDTTPAQIIISGVENGGSYREYEKRVAIEVRDTSGVQAIEVLLNGNKVDVSLENGIYYLTIPESTSSQNIEVKVVDLAGNESSAKVEDFLITSNLFVYLINQLWFKIAGSGVVAAILAMLAMLIIRRRKDRKIEKQQEADSAALRKSTSSGSSGSGGDAAIIAGTGSVDPVDVKVDEAPVSTSVSEESTTGTMDLEVNKETGSLE